MSRRVGSCAFLLAATVSLGASPSLAGVVLSTTPAGLTDISWYQQPFTVQFDVSSYLGNGQKIVSARASASASTPTTGIYPRAGSSNTEYIGKRPYVLFPGEVTYLDVYDTTTDYIYEDTYPDSIRVDTGEGSGVGQVAYGFFGVAYNLFLQEVFNEGRLDRYFGNNFELGYAGLFSATADLTANDLRAVNKTGVATFTVSGVEITQAFLESASFEFELGSATPEPASWALMILGFGTAGAMIRRRRRPVTT